MPLSGATAVAGVFGLRVATPALYALGFAATTAGLHVIGALSGLLVLCRPHGHARLRWVGAAVGAAGAVLLARGPVITPTCVSRVTVFDTMPSPVGALLLIAEDAGLTGLYLTPHRHGPDRNVERVHVAARPGPAAEVVAEARAQLAAYFAGTRTAFSLPLVARGTPFQMRVWTALREIRFGETISYAELARRIAAPTPVPAVGAANGRNPLSIIVPCHRVIGADGSLTGFGGGVERKRWLLEHEGARDVSGPQLVLV